MTTKKSSQVVFTENTVLLSVCFRRPGMRRQVDSRRVKSDADATMLHVSKDIVDSDEYTAIGRADGEFKGYMFRRAIPCHVFRRGVYPLPIALLAEVDGRIEEFRQRRIALVGTFLRVYPAKIEAAKERLGSLYSDEDYPSVNRLRVAFGVDACYVSIGAPELLKGFSGALFDREKAKIEQMWSDAGTEIRDALRAGFAELVRAMGRRLG